jgi:hypothetical protein
MPKTAEVPAKIMPAKKGANHEAKPATDMLHHEGFDGLPVEAYPQKARTGNYSYTIHGTNDAGETVVVEVQLKNKIYYVRKAASTFTGSRTVSWGPLGGCHAAWEYVKERVLQGWHPAT